MICIYILIFLGKLGTSALAEVTAKWWFSKGIAPKMPNKMLQYMAQEVDVLHVYSSQFDPQDFFVGFRSWVRRRVFSVRYHGVGIIGLGCGKHV